jgi:hypothetical protein
MQLRANMTPVNGSLGRAGRREHGVMAKTSAFDAKMVSPSLSKATQTRRSDVIM